MFVLQFFFSLSSHKYYLITKMFKFKIACPQYILVNYKYFHFLFNINLSVDFEITKLFN